MKSQKEVGKELLNRLLATAKREGCEYHPSATRLRRELNEVRRGMEWN